MVILKQRYIGRLSMYRNDLLHWRLLLENIGPHQKTVLSGDFNKVHIGICANNGLGKTFIGKAFSTLQEGNEIINKNELIKEGKRRGRFSVQMSQDGEAIEDVEALFEREQSSTVPVHTNWLYHVYNQDYVKENLDLLGYQPNGDIRGIVLGKVQVDLSKEKWRLEHIKEEGIRLRQEVEGAFEARKRRLRRENNVNPSTTEYKKFNFEEVEKNQLYYLLVKKYEVLDYEYRELVRLPDEIPDIPSIKLHIDETVFETIQELLENSYKKGCFSEQFKQEMEQRSEFIEQGLSYIQEEACPFCHQKFDERASEWVRCYHTYFQDEETKMIRRLQDCKRQLEDFKQQLKTFFSCEYVECKQQYNALACYFNEVEPLENLVLDQSILQAIEIINQCIEEKKLNIAAITLVHKKPIYFIKESLYTLSNEIDQINKKIQLLNLQKNNNASQKLKVRKQICQAAFNELVDQLKPKIERLYQLKEEYRNLACEIREKEYISRTSKRGLVATAFKQLLSLFFDEKYTFDEETFSLYYANRALNNQAYKVLSEGEKEVIAFCYYLASVHRLVQSESDYSRLFLVIDDPVAHMDERYSCLISSILTHLTELYRSDVEIAYIVLSHNQYFINDLKENGCLEKVYYLQESKEALGDVEVAVTIE